MDFVVDLNKVLLVMIAFVSCTSVHCASPYVTEGSCNVECESIFDFGDFIKSYLDKYKEKLLQLEDWKDDNCLVGTFYQKTSSIQEHVKQHNVPLFNHYSISFDMKCMNKEIDDAILYCRNEYKHKMFVKTVDCIIDDIKNTSKFISGMLIQSISDQKSLDFSQLFGNTDISSVFNSLKLKMHDESILSMRQEFLEFTKLDSNERKLLNLIFILNKLSIVGNKQSISTLNKIESIVTESVLQDHTGFTEFLDECSALNPYYNAIKRIGTVTCNFSHYEEFFNYDDLVNFYDALYVLKDSDPRTIAGSIEVLVDNLRTCINIFAMNSCDNQNKDLFSRFVELQNEFSECNV